ncbi:hypothetical protein BHM03_00060041 [Ensete ventricosum]|nr:hypothetical protein BHM03_00060041 [Ensete ventricosum]
MKKQMCSQESKGLQLGEGLGDLSLQLVPIQVHADEAPQVAQLRRDLALEVVPVELPATQATPSVNQARSHLYGDRGQRRKKKAWEGLTEEEEGRRNYRRITRFWESQVTWNQVQGLTRVGSQLCSTLVGSVSRALHACNASPVPNPNQKRTRLSSSKSGEGGKKAHLRDWWTRPEKRRGAGGGREAAPEEKPFEDNWGETRRGETSGLCNGSFKGETPSVNDVGGWGRREKGGLEVSGQKGRRKEAEGRERHAIVVSVGFGFACARVVGWCNHPSSASSRRAIRGGGGGGDLRVERRIHWPQRSEVKS